MGASSYSFTEMLHNTLPHYRRIVKPDDKVLIISDTRVEDDVPHVFAAAARTLDAIPTIMVITPLARDYMDPPEAVFRAAEASDVLHYAASTAFAHSQFGVQMTKLQKRRINSDNIDARQLVSGAILAHIDDINVWRRKISKYWEEGNKVHITSALGTDLWISIEGRRPFRGHNFPHIQFPGGEAMLAPMEDTAEGVLMVDKCVHFIGDLRVPIKLTIEKGAIKKIEGGDEARRFERWLEENSDDNGYRLCGSPSGPIRKPTSWEARARTGSSSAARMSNSGSTTMSAA